MFEGKNIIITGATRGLGKELARAFYAEGANLVICGRDLRKLQIVREELKGGTVGQHLEIISVDIAQTEQIDMLYDFAFTKLGRIDIVINNAGVFGPIGSSDEISWDQLTDCININLLGTVYSSIKAIHFFKEKGIKGKIINLSGGGATKGRPNFISYAITKTAVVRATETLAEEVRDYGITINAMAPGTLDTDMSDYIIMAGKGILSDEVIQQVKHEKRNGMEAMNKAIECAKFLASSEADGISGRLISAAWDDRAYLIENVEKIYEDELYTLRRKVPKEI